jgi:hypothetical protein
MQIATSQSRLQSGKRRQMAVTEWAVRVTNQTAMKILHELVADKLERDPALLRIPLENIDRWLDNGHTAPHRLEQWREIILRAQESEDAFETLLQLLRNTDDPATERLKEFAPFAGVLTAMERRQAVPSCAYHF